MADRVSNSSSLSATSVATTFSSKCATLDVPVTAACQHAKCRPATKHEAPGRRPPHRGHRGLAHLPADHRRLFPPGSAPRKDHGGHDHRLPARRSSRRAGRAGPTRSNPAAPTCWPTFDHHTSNGRTEAINGRLEALRRNALGFRNLTHYESDRYCTAATAPA